MMINIILHFESFDLYAGNKFKYLINTFKDLLE